MTACGVPGQIIVKADANIKSVVKCQAKRRIFLARGNCKIGASMANIGMISFLSPTIECVSPVTIMMMADNQNQLIPSYLPGETHISSVDDHPLEDFQRRRKFNLVNPAERRVVRVLNLGRSWFVQF